VPRKQVTLGQFAAIVQALPEKLSQKTINAARKSASRLAVMVEQSIRTNSPFALVDRGRLVQSVQVIPTPTGAIVRVDAPYAAPLEYGARPFMPPLQPILDWATRKGFDNPMAVAMAVRWQFFRHGMAPKRFFWRAVQQWKATNDLPKEIRKQLLQLPPGATKPGVG
jgi:hypothetical protein